MEFTAEMIAGFLDGQVVGDPNAKVSNLAKIEEGSAGTLAFLANPKYEQYIYTTKASIVIVNKSFEPSAPVETTMVKVEDAYSCFAKLLEIYAASRPQKKGISTQAAIAEGVEIDSESYVGQFAVISSGVKIGSNVKIYPQVYVGDNVKIGDNVTLYAGVKIYEDCVIGNNVTIHAGSVIGADGFGFAPDENGVFNKVPQLGNVVLEDNVDIGANTCIDRATMGSTIIKKGVKLDNLIQVGHNVVIGENTVSAAQMGVAGSTKVGKNCMMGGQVGIAGHLNVGDNVKIASQSGISNNVDSNLTIMGTPSLAGTKFHRMFAVMQKLPDMNMKLSKLEKEVSKLKNE